MENGEGRPRNWVLPGLLITCVVVAASFFLFLHHASPRWCLASGRCAPTDTWATDDPREFTSDCPGGSDTMMQYGSRVYIRDLDNNPSRASGVTYDGDAALPSDAANTGWSSGERQLWTSPSETDSVGPTSIFIVYHDHVERWPHLDIGCA